MRKKANIFAAIVSLPAVILQEIVEFFQRIFKDEKKILAEREEVDE